MPLSVITRTVRVAVEGVTANGQPWANVLHCRHAATAPDAAALAALAGTVEDLYSASPYAAPAHGWSYFSAAPAEAQLITLTPLDGTSASTDFPIAISGTAAQQQLPGQDATLISFKTGLRGRSYRGRCFWAAPYEGMTNADGTPTTLTKDDIRLQFTAWAADLASVSWEHVVASYLHSTAQTVTTYIVRPYFGHQSRRRR